MRTTLYNNPILSNQSLSVVNDGTQKGHFFIMPKKPSGGQGPKNQIPPTAQKQVPLSPEKHAIHPDRVSADQVRQKDDDNGAPEGTQRLTHQVLVQSREDEDASEPMELTHDSVHKSQGDAAGSIEPPYEIEQPEPINTRQEPEPEPEQEPINTQQEQEQEQDHELEKHLNPASVESISLDSREKDTQVFIPMVTHEHDVPQETSASNRDPSKASPNSSPAADSAKLHNESDENDSVVSLLSYAIHQNPCPSQTHPQPEVPLDGSEKLDHTNRDSGGASSGFHGHSQDPEQQRQVSPKQMVPTAELGAQNHAQNVDAKENITTSHAGPVENVQMQGPISSSHSQLYPQPAFSHPQVQMAQYPMQSSDQLGHIQNSQAYNQMLQSYYQQQLVQQQLLQLQPYLQQPPPQQPLPALQQMQQSHQPPLHQHEQMLQHQQYIQPQQQIQPPTDQAQQYMLYMQQQQYMQQQYQQQYQQQAQRYQQQLLQQYNLQGEQGYQQQQQQQQIHLSYYQQVHF